MIIALEQTYQFHRDFLEKAAERILSPFSIFILKLFLRTRVNPTEI